MNRWLHSQPTNTRTNNSMCSMNLQKQCVSARQHLYASGCSWPSSPMAGKDTESIDCK